MPPLSLTTMSPYFSNNATKTGNITEIFNECGSFTPTGQSSSLSFVKMLSQRRHTVGPVHKPVYPAGLNLESSKEVKNILPQTNLKQNLLLVSNLPPDSFSVKNSHLLKPPLALLGISPSGRRASDGGYHLQKNQKSHTQNLENCFSSTRVFKQPEEQSILPAFDTCSEAGGSSEEPPNHQMVEQYLKSRGQMKRHTIPESPRKRRTGLHTVMEKPPVINPELVEEVESRIKNQTPCKPAHLNNQMPKQRPAQTNLSTVLEMGKLRGPEARDSLPFSSARGYNETAIIPQDSALPAKHLIMMQEDILRQRKETQSSGGSFESGSSGYMSSQLQLSPSSPNAQEMYYGSSQARRASDSGVKMSLSNKVGPEMMGLSQGSKVEDKEPIQQLYHEMYNSELSVPIPYISNSRRYSYPDSPAHVPWDQSNQPARLSEHLQHLKLQKKTQGTPNLVVLSEDTNVDPRAVSCQPPQSNNCWKGSITKGLPSRNTPCSTDQNLMRAAEAYTLVNPGMTGVSKSFDENPSKHPCIPVTTPSSWNNQQSTSIYETGKEVTSEDPFRPGICITRDEDLFFSNGEPMDQSN